MASLGNPFAMMSPAIRSLSMPRTLHAFASIMAELPLLSLYHVYSFVGGGRSSLCSPFCALLSCVLASAAGVVGGTFELAGGGADWTGAGLYMEASGAGADGFTWGFSDILKSAFKQEKFWQENSAGEL